MIVNAQVPLHRLILSLSEALDYVHPEITDHQQRVAYVALRLARRLGMAKAELLDVFLAGALHDIGLIRVENRLLLRDRRALEQVTWHGEAGWQLLQADPLFARAAEMVRFHHTSWADGAGRQRGGSPVPLGAHVLFLADAVERSIDRDVPVLEQAKFITRQVESGAGRLFHPDCADAFRGVAEPEAFWLDCVSTRIYAVLLRQIDWPVLVLDAAALEPIAEIFARMVDAMSRWTATHSAGVAATAAALAARLSFSPREQRLMRAAGYLHDLGKLSVPGEILDKPGKLTPAQWAVMKGHTYHTFRILTTIGGMSEISEWAAFHHERLDGSGYPFRHSGQDLLLGSRIMAVADIFTALTEDRPYRRGRPVEEAMDSLTRLADQHALDGDVVATLGKECRAVAATCKQAQAAYARQQARLAETMGSRPADVPCPADVADPS